MVDDYSSDERTLELHIIRKDMVKVQGMDPAQEAMLIIYRLAGAIRTLAYHIEQLEKRRG